LSCLPFAIELSGDLFIIVFFRHRADFSNKGVGTTDCLGAVWLATHIDRFGCSALQQLRRRYFPPQTSSVRRRTAVLCNQPHTLQIGVDHAVPGAFILIERGLCRGDAGIVDDRMNRTKSFLGLFHSIVDLVGERDVEHDALRLAAGRVDFRNR
jgi:hypothetical protein